MVCHRCPFPGWLSSLLLLIWEFISGMGMGGCKLFFYALIWYILILTWWIALIDLLVVNQPHIPRLNAFCSHVLSFCITGFILLIFHYGFLHLILWMIMIFILVSSNLVVMYLDMVFFVVFFLLGIHWESWICEL